jgi:hypothetical protein
MDEIYIDEAIRWIEKSNAGLEPELMSAADARELLDSYAQARRLIDFGVAALTRKVQDPKEVARITGTSVGAAKETVDTGKVLTSAPEFETAFRNGEVSIDQAREIAKAERSAPGSADTLLRVANAEPLHVLKDKARRVALDAEQHRDLSTRQRDARNARHYSDDLGMVHVHLTLEPHVGTPIVARAEAEAQRLVREAKREDQGEPFERHLADSFVSLLSGSSGGRAKRPELVVLVSHGVAKRGME